MEKQHENMIAIKRNQQRIETIAAMKSLQSQMLDVSMRMEALNEGQETERHAKELTGASVILGGWINHLKINGLSK